MNKKHLASILKEKWPIIAILLIIALSMHIRLLDYKWSYLRNIDSYVYYRQMDEIVQNNGILPNYDPYVTAPDGNIIEGNTFAGNFYVYLGAYSYSFFHSFMPNMELWEFLVWFPPLIASLMAIPMYYIGKTLYDRRAGVLAALFIVFDISIIARSLGGDPDSDAIVLLIPMIIIAFYLHIYKRMDKEKISLMRLGIYTAIFGLLLFVWLNTWGGGYWYVIWLITGFVVLKIAADLAVKRNFEAVKKHKYILLNLAGGFLIFSILAVAIGSINMIGAMISGPFSFVEIKDESNREYPNVYVSVAELQAPGDVKAIIQKITPIDINANPVSILITPFFLLVYSLIYLAYSYMKKRQHMDTFILLLIWFIGPFVSTIIAIRFSILFSAPIAIGSAIFISKILRMTVDGEKLED